MSTTSNTTVPLDRAISYIGQWIGQYTDPEKPPYENPARAHLIPLKDLLDCMMEMGMAEKKSDGTYSITPSEGRGLRAYMALNLNESDPYKQQKLLIVGTFLENGIYHDIVEDGKPQPNSLFVEKLEGLEGSGVFDFTTPCPSECDPDSPLNL